MKDRTFALRQFGAPAGGVGASAPADMGRAEFGCAVHEMGEKGQLLLDVTFVPAAINQDHRARRPSLREGDGRRGVADALASGDGEEGFEAGEGPGTEKESSMPRASRTSAALALERENSTSSSSGRRVKSSPLVLRGLKETVIGGLERLGAAKRQGREGGRRPFGPRPRGVSPRRLRSGRRRPSSRPSPQRRPRRLSSLRR